MRESLKKLKLPLKKAYWGNKVECNICNTSYSVFRTTGSGKKKRVNSGCYHCGSLERHRLLWYFIEKNHLISNLHKLLHFGPEKMFYKKFSSILNDGYFPVDLFPEIYNFKGKVPVKKCDITDIHFDSENFDLVVCNHVLEHIPDDSTAISEIYRVLKAGGKALVQVPMKKGVDQTYEDFSITEPTERVEAFGQEDHVRWYGFDIIERFKKAGFKAECYLAEDIMTETEIEKYSVRYSKSELLKDERVYLLTKEK